MLNNITKYQIHRKPKHFTCTVSQYKHNYVQKCIHSLRNQQNKNELESYCCIYVQDIYKRTI